MSKVQRIAIVDFHNGVNAKGNSTITNARTIAVLVREGWAVHPMHVTPAIARLGKVRTAYVTRAGLVAAGIDMDAIHAEALEVNAMCCTLNPLGHARAECPNWTDRLSAEGRQVIRDAAHAEALTEYREVTRAARKADADAYQRELQRSMGLRVRA